MRHAQLKPQTERQGAGVYLKLLQRGGPIPGTGRTARLIQQVAVIGDAQLRETGGTGGLHHAGERRLTVGRDLGVGMIVGEIHIRPPENRRGYIGLWIFGLPVRRASLAAISAILSHTMQGPSNRSGQGRRGRKVRLPRPSCRTPWHGRGGAWEWRSDRQRQGLGPG